jgi:hypothetical protein
MAQIKRNKFRVLLAVLFLIIGSGTVVAAIYIALRFTLFTPVEEYPKVTFWKWSTSEKKKTFDCSMNIFGGIKTVGENATHGIFNDDSIQHQCYLRLESLTNLANIARLNITIYDSTSTILTKEWSDFNTLPTPWEPFTVNPNTKYAIRIEITASSAPVESSQFVIEIKEENP